MLNSFVEIKEIPQDAELIGSYLKWAKPITRWGPSATKISLLITDNNCLIFVKDVFRHKFHYDIMMDSKIGGGGYGTFIKTSIKPIVSFSDFGNNNEDWNLINNTILDCLLGKEWSSKTSSSRPDIVKNSSTTLELITRGINPLIGFDLYTSDIIQRKTIVEEYKRNPVLLKFMNDIQEELRSCLDQYLIKDLVLIVESYFSTSYLV